MWSELGSVIYTEPPGCTAVSRVVYILWGSDSVLLLSQGELVDLADSSPSQKRVVTCGGEHQDQDIVQGSASKQTPVSLCIWYSKPM